MSWTPPAAASTPVPAAEPYFWPPPAGGWAPPPPTRGGLRWWAVALIAAGTFVAGGFSGGVVAVVLWATFGVEQAPVTTTVGPDGEITPFIAEVGTCVDGDVHIDFSGVPAVSRITGAVPCGGSHDLEVFAAIDAPVGATNRYPEVDLSYFGDEACMLAFGPYIGTTYEASELEFIAAVPSSGAWAEGEREVRCLLFHMDGLILTGSSRSSRR